MKHDDPTADSKPMDWAIRTLPEGGRYTRHPNGRESFAHPDGSREDRCPDGTSRHESAKGGTFYQLKPEPSLVQRLLGKRSPEQQALHLPPSYRTR